jgi:Na+-transporting methylmalonyl-CoA/oxaloacetate decarboxylase gamma subunit
MQAWMVFQFAFALAVVISCLALVIGRLHIIERAEEQELWKEWKEKITAIR